jgi:hypothetical protein
MLFTYSELEQLTDRQLEALHSQLLSMLMATNRYSQARRLILGALSRIEQLFGSRAYSQKPRISRGF